MTLLRAADAATLPSVAAVMCAMGLVAAFVPARRASRVDPLTALRHE
jgi:ABC-type antimicrobial peptide transport system permease subunit